MAARSPQEKKQLSYAKDRRNAYGENDKASRKNLPRTAALVRRAARRAAHQLLRHPATRDHVDLDEAEATGVRLAGAHRAFLRSRIQHRKFPDIALGQYLRARRARRGS